MPFIGDLDGFILKSGEQAAEDSLRWMQHDENMLLGAHTHLPHYEVHVCAGGLRRRSSFGCCESAEFELDNDYFTSMMQAGQQPCGWDDHRMPLSGYMSPTTSNAVGHTQPTCEFHRLPLSGYLSPTMSNAVGHTQPSCEFQGQTSMPPATMATSDVDRGMHAPLDMGGLCDLGFLLSYPVPFPFPLTPSAPLSYHLKQSEAKLSPPHATSKFDAHAPKIPIQKVPLLIPTKTKTRAPRLPSRELSVGLLELCEVTLVKPRIRRRKMGDGDKHSLGGRSEVILSEGELIPIALTPEILRSCFGIPLHEAAQTLGICATAVKKCCRKMGIMEWPYQRIKPIRTRLTHLRLSPKSPKMDQEIEQLLRKEAALLQG
jgi:hypothetical protein